MSTPCYQCSGDLSDNAFGRSERCPACGADTRCCRNCAFEEPSYRSECRETQAEPVRDRERANYCDYFRPHKGPARANLRSGGTGARTAFDTLFRKGSARRDEGVDDLA
jgi:hypothetical protein